MQKFFLVVSSLLALGLAASSCASELDASEKAAIEHQKVVDYAVSTGTALVVPADVGTLGATLHDDGYSLGLGVAGRPGIEFTGRLCVSLSKQRALEICNTTGGGGIIDIYTVEEVDGAYVVSTQPIYEREIKIGSDGASLAQAFVYGRELIWTG